MNITKISPKFIISHSSKTKKANAHPNTQHLQNKKEGSSVKTYYFPVSFGNSQKTQLTDEDYNNAKEYWQSYLKSPSNKIDLEKLNGIQKGIEVFEGLSMKEIAYMALNGKINIALNRGCKNMCAHCYCSATPITNKTLDKMSYENFKSLSDGIKELKKRLDYDDCTIKELFYDSDCIDIEISDKDGNIYDYIDCLEEIKDVSDLNPLFDTSGWNPNIEKYQKRAQKFVDYVLRPENRNLKGNINISINPYHSLYTKSAELRKEGKIELADEMEQDYIKRMANVLFTFTPIIKHNVNILARAIPKEKTNTGLDEIALRKLTNKIFSCLEEMYTKDLEGKQKYAKNKGDIEYFIEYYRNNSKENAGEVRPIGRAQGLFIEPDNIEDSINYFKEVLEYEPEWITRVINPNGKVIVAFNDITTKTDIRLNFKDSNKSSKPLAYQIEY